MSAMQALQELGLTEYEGRAYMTLVDGGELTGYELAKKSGIPRANIYSVIDKLIQRGAAQRLEHTSGRRYSAIPPKQLLDGIETDQKRALAAAKHALARPPRQREPAAVFNLRNDELLARARQLIGACEKTLLIAIQPQESKLLADALQAARERGIAITTLCLQACERECGGCQGEIHRYGLAPDDGTRWLVLVVDCATTLVGQFDEDEVDGIVTEQRLMVRLAEAYVRQSLTLAMLGDELANYKELLSKGARRQLDQLLPDGRSSINTHSPGDAASS